jgi:lysophospholipase L1-like esterase
MFSKRPKKSSWSMSDSRYSRSRRAPSIPRPFIIASIPLAILGLELLLRLAAGLLGKGDEMAAYRGAPPVVSAYELRYLTRSGDPIAGLPGQGQLAVKQTATTGYQLVENQTSPYFKINAQGLRSDQPLEAVKPPGEVRILLLGGSAAFGQFSPNNGVTFGQQLEARLNQQVKAQKDGSQQYRPDVLPYYADELEKALKLPPKIREARYRVIDAAVPGYGSGNTLAQFSAQNYQADVVAVVDGYTDLLLPSTQPAAEIPNLDRLVAHPIGHLWSSTVEGVKAFLGQSYIVKAIPFWLTQPQPGVAQLVDPAVESSGSLADRLTPDETELKARVQRYQRHLQQLAALTSAAKLPLVVALQPELSRRRPSNLSARERQVLEQAGSNYGARVKAGYGLLVQATEAVKKENPGVTLVKLQEPFDGLKGEGFVDPIHLADGGQKLVADRLYEAIAPKLQVQPKPFGGETPGFS